MNLGGNVYASFLNRHSGGFPTDESTVEMVDFFQWNALKNWESLSTATPAPAVNQVGSLGIQLFHSLGELIVLEIKIRGTCDMSLGKLFRSPNVEDDDGAVFSYQLPSFLG